MQSSTTYDGTFTRRDTLYNHENCRHFQTEIILFGDQHFLIRMKFSVFASGEHCLRLKHSTAFVSKTLRSFRTHCCIRYEHITAFLLNRLLRSIVFKMNAVRSPVNAGERPKM